MYHVDICSELENGPDSDALHMLVNQWDIGEGRLRPRPVSKLSQEPINKVKCDLCNKLFRAEYIKVCICDNFFSRNTKNFD